ncbi:MAG: hypothetical protein US83_C0010G0028 [Candidatus Falkowbacteria bacterium GW2011_GWC2_38_22]|uniref:EF-hand domain-containing protein n=1 Tax=Candidatus Falkowbacteria bacterium GW2011_GWE1_38_31 TaxID=1618638 RepID=A0A0G0MZH2_9BACT|nr:MAG: hypothetical protein US73_C0005G0028 [Candidatus Falkowbacteria bacterium GW2011_GWF2_38_1205]KKQ60994.1 MAG: hypothetical protein US83_C0010G0028 [Candidatus Falkowbacteria bacterium GW2011_GWC2_38_22]KKQ63477.1 MAG: hypothetical protein US84_C0006G0080 [Candidatus Falkowbacteria bacterium GW2011_GWF1_38_22]KKQ65452.1 MAG: hypothetical protein US87_C0007G0028 [Candidatus Falkowbacteria bacterium GW2011_GWE2_38_254]KKQ70241.1 MAG: hypothetical protein US91_C0006G0080 [Candidatus Falkowb
MPYFKFKNISLFFFALLTLPVFFFCLSNNPVQAQVEEEECAEASFSIIARSSTGDFIPSITVEVFEQITDADNRPKPGTKIASGKTSAITGIFSYTLKKPSGKQYAIKMNATDKDATAFWFYDSLTLNCGESKEVTKSLSALEIVIRDALGVLKTNEQFSIYAQKYDADNKPLKEKLSLIASLNTGEGGKSTIYVPASSNFINGSGAAYYIFEKINANGGSYSQYDIHASEGNTTKIDYKLSRLKLEMQDINGVSFPANSKIEIFSQVKNEDNVSVLSTKIKDVYTDDLGMVNFEYPAGIYALRLLGSSGVYTYFWDIEIRDQTQTTYQLKTNEEWLPSGGACEASSNFTLFTRDLDYRLIAGLNFNIYEQGVNADGKPYALGKLSGGTINESGQSTIIINPDPRKKYALQIYEKNEKVGDFWFFDQIQFACGQNMEVTKQLPALNIILRDSKGELLRNQLFSLYTEKFDADEKPIKEKKDLVSDKFDSGESGKITVYLAANHPYLKEKRGSYVITLTNKDKITFTEYGINISPSQNLELDYSLSGLAITYKNAEGKINSEKTVDIYEQVQNAERQNILGKKIKSLKTDAYGIASLEYPTGSFAAVVTDSLQQKNIFWNLLIKNRQMSKTELNENKIRINIKDGTGKKISKKMTISVYTLKKTQDAYTIDKKLKSLSSEADGTLDASLAPGAYLFSVSDQKIEYGKAIYAENGKAQTLEIKMSSAEKILSGQKFKLGSADSLSLAEKMKGRLLLQVENNGETWYVDPNTLKRFYVKDGPTAYETLRKFGLGITNADLNKIPVGLDARFEEWDYDGDLVPDKMEEALGTDMYEYDTDNDGYNDGEELINGYNTLGAGKHNLDNNLAKRLGGKILLQTESRGEAWYINPSDNRRYYMKDGESAYEIMRFLSLGITNANLEKIEEGK